MYAIISDRGRQIVVRPNAYIACDAMKDCEPDSQVTFDRVLLVSDEGNVRVGKPFVEGASVTGRVICGFRGPKETVFRFKRRKNVRRKRGHRQDYVRIQIESIQA